MLSKRVGSNKGNIVFHRVIFCSFMAYSHARRLLVMFIVQNVLFMLFMLSLLPAGAGFLLFCHKLIRLKTLHVDFRTPGNPQMFR